jgi:hypothetical protein
VIIRIASAGNLGCQWPSESSASGRAIAELGQRATPSRGFDERHARSVRGCLRVGLSLLGSLENTNQKHTWGG